MYVIVSYWANINRLIDHKSDYGLFADINNTPLQDDPYTCVLQGKVTCFLLEVQKEIPTFVILDFLQNLF